MRSIDIAPADLETVRRILREHTPELEVRAFGSRVSWTTRATSDLDLALMTDEPLSTARMAELKAAFTKSDLPFRVDVVDWASTSESFREVIERDYVVLAASDGEPFDGSNSGMADGWQTVTVADIAEKVAMGPFGSSIKVNTFVPEGVPVISGQHLHGIRVDDAPGFNFVTPEHAERLANANVRRGDIVFTHAGNIGQVAYIPEDSRFDRYVISQRQFYMRCDRAKAIHEFLAIYFTSPAGQHQLLANASQVGVPSIAQPVTYLRTIEIPLPPLPEQRAIAHVLGTLDDKIELNRRMNETLEAMARALFKSWFVDFDPVRAKAALKRRAGGGNEWTLERARAYLDGMGKEIAALFPDSFVDSELGQIPEGWGVVPLPEIIEVNPTRSLQKGEIAPYLDMANMPTRGHAPDTVTDRPFGSGMRFANGDTLVARITPCLENGKTAYVDFLPDGQIGWGSTEYIVLRPKPPHPDEFAYCLARSAGFREFAIQGMTGTSGRQRVPATALLHFRLPSPPKQITGIFGITVHSLFARSSEAVCESRAFAALRDALLPKLVSGEIRLPKVEKVVETVA